VSLVRLFLARGHVPDPLCEEVFWSAVETTGSTRICQDGRPRPREPELVIKICEPDATGIGRQATTIAGALHSVVPNRGQEAWCRLTLSRACGWQRIETWDRVFCVVPSVHVGALLKWCWWIVRF
jgi:hypothetical protein